MRFLHLALLSLLFAVPAAAQSFCGNGVVDPGEDCDQGASPPACLLSFLWHPPATCEACGFDCTWQDFTVDNFEQLVDDDVPTGAKDSFYITMESDGRLEARTGANGCGSNDTILELLAVNPTTGATSQVDINDDANGGLCSEIVAGLVVGTYRLDVRAYNGGALSNYGLDLGLWYDAPAGNEYLGGYYTEGDDRFEVHHPGGPLEVSTMGAPGTSACPSGMDTVIKLIDQSNQQLVANNDDANGTFCSEISEPNLQPGVYEVEVRGYGTTIAPEYQFLSLP